MDTKTKQQEEYQKLVDEVSPNSKILFNCIKAFFVGGVICTIGQLFTNFFLTLGIEEDIVKTYTSVLIIFITVALTSLGVYDKIGKFGGAGSFVPITGFANAVAAAALDYKKEGFVLGMGAKIFTIAGPVIFYGTISSVVVGIIYYFLR